MNDTFVFFGIKLLFSAIIAAFFAGIVFFARKREKGLNTSETAPRYPAYFYNRVFLLLVLLVDTVCYAILYGAKITAIVLVNTCLIVFLHFSVYFLILLPLMPLLRRRVSATVCAVLWFLPVYLFLVLLYNMQVTQPAVVIPISLNAIQTILWVWLAGFAGVMGYKILSHLWFRRRLLRGAAPVTDKRILEVWEEELHRANLKNPRFRLVVSPQTATPLTVGLFQRTARVVLPQRQYAPEDLSLIFRHELIHLGRGDAWSKFFLVLCTAACWFNPLVWLAARKSADDMELSCDETALLDCGEEVRRRYADLLLKTAGDQRGFTTCLSASAQALRYRLSGVMTPTQKGSGAVVVGVVCFLLVISSGYVALGYQAGRGEEVLFQGLDPDSFTLSSVSRLNDPDPTERHCTDPDGLRDYLCSLSLEEVLGNYNYTKGKDSYLLFFDSPESSPAFRLQGDFIEVFTFQEGDHPRAYHVAGGVDHERLDACFVVYPALTYQLTKEEREDVPPSHFTLPDPQASLNWVRRADGTTVYGPREVDLESGMYRSHLPIQATLVFSLPMEGPVTVTVSNWENTSQYTLTLEGPDYTMDLPPYPAHYTVEGAFLGTDGELLQAGYSFNLGETQLLRSTSTTKTNSKTGAAVTPRHLLERGEP